MSIFKPKEEKHAICIIETMVQKYEKPVYAGYCNAIERNLPKVEFNIYVDTDNKVIHIYDPFEQHTQSVINLLTETFVTELCEKLKVNKKKYEIYVYMKPIHSIEPHMAVYNYKNNDFYAWQPEKLFDYFTEVAKEESSLI